MSLTAMVVLLAATAGGQADDGALVRQARRVLATKLAVGRLDKGVSVYTDRGGSVETFPGELAGWTLITLASELRWAKLEGLCFSLDRPAAVYVGYHEQIKQPPDWLTRRFKKTALKIGAHAPQTRGPGGRPEQRWNFELWKASVEAGPVALGANKNEALPYIVLVEGTAQPKDLHYAGPLPGALAGAVKEGGPAYPDRPYVLKDLPAALDGAALLAMNQGYALEDGRYSGTHLRVPWIDTAGREVTLARDMVAYIAYDAGSPSVPEWMTQAGFKKTSLSLKVAGMKFYDDRAMAVYARECKAGERLWLGPNRGTGWSGWPLQYLAMLKGAPVPDGPGRPD